MLSVIDAMNASKGFIRPMREGEELVKSGMIVSVGKKEKNNDVVHVQALVLRTSSLQKEPAIVEMWVDTSKEYGDRILKDNEAELRKHCNCPAGNSEKCKHVIAVILCLTNLNENDLEDFSCTDVEKQWGILKASTLKEYKAKRLHDLCHVKEHRQIIRRFIA
ncbi:hypothetical protein ABEB36_014581 [Hypothenemus hampei]|uniref:SWIM-type domain-containing protein n=1 Tax=Hypothenemus hampei TaxID=57062 RepID=A0ABD1E279_HYPHA